MTIGSLAEEDSSTLRLCLDAIVAGGGGGGGEDGGQVVAAQRGSRPQFLCDLDAERRLAIIRVEPRKVSNRMRIDCGFIANQASQLALF